MRGKHEEKKRREEEERRMQGWAVCGAMEELKKKMISCTFASVTHTLLAQTF
jgi:hypothetical protein